MIRGVLKVFLAAAAVLALAPAAAFAQEGQIGGSVRDTSGALMPGVTVEVTSPALIEKVRTATTDASGQYRITNLPVGTYKVTFSLEGFTKQERDDVILTSGFTAPVNGTLTVGQLAETVVVSGATPIVDVQNAREVLNFQGDELAELPSSRNINSLLSLTPGIASNYRPTTAFGAPGVCVGGIGVFCNPGLNGFNVGDTDTTNLSQGRVLVDGAVINTNGALPIVGQTGGYTADIANAQEVNIQVNGALGESETGGASINIVPKTGGNTFAGDFNMTYTTDRWFDRNTSNYPTVPALFQAVKNDHDVSMAFGGPIKRDRLWFFSVARDQGIHKLPVGVDFWPNKHEGKWGYNYQPDRSQERVTYTNVWRNVNARVTWQASPKNKLNFFWDEQDFCQDPCTGVVSVYTSPESWFSPQTRPNRLQQASWTNPITNKILLEAGASVTRQKYNTTEHREFTNPTGIPRVNELGDTAGMDEVAPRVNQFAGGAFFILTSGSLNSQLAGGGAEIRDFGAYRSRASASYVSGTHHIKVGYDGSYFNQTQMNKVNDLNLSYNYQWPAATLDCSIPLNCGNTSLQFPSDPNNMARRPVPNTVDFNTGPGTLKDHVMYAALYAQDTWTFRRVTLSGAVRYDHATSGFGETCVGPGTYVPVQANGQRSYCTPEGNGVNYKDITPRYGATWDVWGTGKTAVRFNGGKFLNAGGITGLYSGSNPARRGVQYLRRTWNDVDGDRIVDCDLMNFANNGECLGFVNAPGAGTGNTPRTDDTLRYGRDPATLDASGTPVGLAISQCGRTESGIPAAVQSYCSQYGESLVDGWGRRRSEWQMGFGIQHEILPRLSGEFTFNHRKYLNFTVSDTLNIGCDRFNAAVDVRACQDAMLGYRNPSYDFYTVIAPTDPRLPNGGGYRILGLNTDATTLPVGQPIAQSYMKEYEYDWNGFDTNFAWRGPKGIRVQGGTGTARTQRDTCFAMVDAPDVRGREGAEHRAGCKTETPWQTTLKGSASYTIPWADVLVSTVFQSLPGVEQTASMTYSKDQVLWNAESAARATQPCAVPANGTGCLGATRATTTQAVQLLLNNEYYGERVTLFDIKIAKIIRIQNRRLNVGVDVYNFMNSDAITAYNATFTPDNPATPANENAWLNPTGLVAPRFVRVQVAFSF
jgi:hypothetical protein